MTSLLPYLKYVSHDLSKSRPEENPKFTAFQKMVLHLLLVLPKIPNAHVTCMVINASGSPTARAEGVGETPPSPGSTCAPSHHFYADLSHHSTEEQEEIQPGLVAGRLPTPQPGPPSWWLRGIGPSKSTWKQTFYTTLGSLFLGVLILHVTILNVFLNNKNSNSAFT